MGVETRRNGKQYYYRKHRIGDKVLSEYIGGGGDVAELCAGLDAHERRKAQRERQAWQATVEAEAAVDRQLDAIGAQLRTLVEATLLAAGYHQHKRQWRKKRG